MSWKDKNAQTRLDRYAAIVVSLLVVVLVGGGLLAAAAKFNQVLDRVDLIAQQRIGC